MKKTFLMLVLAMMTSAAVKAQNTTVNMKLTGLSDTAKVELELIDGQRQSPVYAALADGGSVSLDIPEGKEGRGYWLKVGGKYVGKCILLGAGENATVTGQVKIDPTGVCSIDHFAVSGSKVNDAYQKNKLNRDELNKAYDAYMNDPIYREYTKAEEEKDSVRTSEIMKTDDWKKFMDKEKSFFHMVDSTFKAVHKANAGSWMGAFMILTDYSYITNEQLPEYELLSDEAKNSFYGKIIRDKIIPSSVEGSVMPDFTFTDHNTGKEMSLKDVLKDSKCVLVDFWASWCRPCRNEIPNLKANYEKYHEKGFNIVSISADDKEANWLKALDEEKMGWPQGRDADGKIENSYNVQYYPTTYLLSSNGQVIAKDIRGEELGSKLAELF